MKILFTTALTPDFYENRKKEYIESFDISKNLIGLENIQIIECLKSDGDFLNELTDKIYFSNTNDNSLNKGVKEGKSIKKFLDDNTFDDEEIIIKQTGRYKFISNLFFNNLDKDVDVNVLYGENNNCFFGVFAIKFKWFKHFINTLDFIYMENNFISIETLLSNYISKQNLVVKKHEKIDVYSNINNNHLVIW